MTPTPFERTKTGSDGMAYQRKIAMKLALNATLKNRPFKLATEMTIAGKFDDVVLHLEDTEEWWLIQAKHTKNSAQLTTEALFKDDAGDFAMSKYLESYCNVKEGWPYAGNRMRFIILTNRVIHDSLNAVCEEVKLDDMLSFGQETKHYKVKPDAIQLNTLLIQAKQRFDDFCDKVKDNLQCSDLKKKSKFLLEHKTSLKPIFFKTAGQLELKDEISMEGSSLRTRKLFEILKQTNCTTVSVDSKTLHDFFEGKSRKQHIPSFVNESIFNNFVTDLIISVSQPNDDEMLNILGKEMRVWMQSFIPPDDFRKLPSSDIKQSYTSLESKFNAWDETQNPNFLQLQDTQMWLKNIKNENDLKVKQLSKRSCLSFKETRRYYINRRLSYSAEHEGNQNSTESLKPKQVQFDNLNEHDFVDQLYTRFKDQNSFLLVAEAGMGKSTLWQFLAFEAQKKYPKKHVYLFYMNNICKNKQELKTINDALRIFNGHCFEESCKVFNSEKNEIILFLDGFDEAGSNKIEMALEAIQELIKRKNFKILISSRKKEQEKLEKKLNIKAMIVKPLSYGDQFHFLKQFWNVQDPVSDEDSNCLKLVLKPFHKKTLNKKSDLLGIPLLLKMLAENCSDSEKNDTFSISNIEHIIKNTLTISDIYYKFVTKSLQLTYNKLHSLPPGTEIPSRCTTLLKDWKHNYQQIALRESFPPKLSFLLCGEIDTITSNTVYDCEGSLIIEVYDNQPRFIHQSYSEYLVAEYLRDVVKRKDVNGKKGIIKFLKNFDVIRMFFFEMVNSEGDDVKLLDFIKSIGKNAAFWACEINCKKLVEFLQKHYNYKTISFANHKDSLLHVAVRSNAYETLKYLLLLSTNSDGIIGEIESATHQAEKKLLDVNVRNNYGQSPFQVADKNDLGMLKLLVSNGANISLGDYRERTLLHHAVEQGSIHLIEILIEQNIDVNAQNYRGETALHLAVEGDKIDTLKLLTLKGRNIALVDRYQNSLLHIAVRRGSIELIEYLIEQNINVNARNSHGKTALHLAVEDDKIDTLKLLILKGGNIALVDRYQNSLLHIAVRKGSIELIKYLIEQNKNVNARNSNRETALHLAAKGDEIDTIKLLVSKGGNIAIVDRFQNTILHQAARKGSIELIEYLIEQNINVNAQNFFGQTALHLAAVGDKIETVKLLVSKGGDIALVDNRKNTILHKATVWGSIKLIEYLIEQNINVNAQNKYGDTALELLKVCDKNYHKIKLLISKGASIEVVYKYENTILHQAARSDSFELIEYLIEQNINVNAQNSYGSTALKLLKVCDKNYHKIKLLISKGASIEVVYENGNKILHEAAEEGSIELIEYLFEQNINVNAQNSRGETALHLAAKGDKIETVKLLVSKGGNIALVDRYEDTVLHVAARWGSNKVIEYLTEQNINVNAQNTYGKTALQLLKVCDNNYHAFKLLISKGASIKVIYENGNEILHEAVRWGSIELIEYLIEQNINVNAQNYFEETALHLAAARDNIETVKLLVSRGGNIALVDDEKNTILHRAARWGSLELIEYLIEQNINVNAQNSHGKTALYLALENTIKVVRLLASKGGSI